MKSLVSALPFCFIGAQLFCQEPAPVAAPPKDPAYPQLELLARAMEIIRQNYVDEKKVTYEQLIEGALEGMLKKLDPHCEYMARSLFEEMQQEQRDTSEGVGITVALRNGTLTIISVDENGPAAKAGVIPDDQLIRIGDVLTDNMSTMESMQHLKCKAGEALRITVRRPGTKQFLDFNLVRAALQDPASLESRTFGVLRAAGLLDLTEGLLPLAEGVEIIAALRGPRHVVGREGNTNRRQTDQVGDAASKMIGLIWLHAKKLLRVG